MKTPHDRHDDEVASYLRSFREDVVPAHAKRRAMLALGLPAAAVTSGAAGAASAAMGATRLVGMAVAKSIAGGAVAGALVLGASTYVQEHVSTVHGPGVHRPETSLSAPSSGSTARRRELSPTPTEQAFRSAPPSLLAHEAEGKPPSSASQEARGKSAAPLLARRRAFTGAVDAAPAPNGEGAAADRGRPSVTPPSELGTSPGAPPSGWTPASAGSTTVPGVPLSPEARPSALGREVLLLDQARAALSSGDTLAARMRLDEYAEQFATGKLGPEALMLRVESLLVEGDTAQAHDIARAFEEAHPGDSHVRRLRSLLKR